MYSVIIYLEYVEQSRVYRVCTYVTLLTPGMSPPLPPSRSQSLRNGAVLGRVVVMRRHSPRTLQSPESPAANYHPNPAGGGGDCGTLRTYMHTVSALGGAGGLARGKGMYCTELSRAELSGRASPIRSDLASTCRSLVSLWGRAADGRRYDTSIRLHTWLFSASRRSDGRTDGGALSSRRRACPADPIAAAEP